MTNAEPYQIPEPDADAIILAPALRLDPAEVIRDHIERKRLSRNDVAGVLKCSGTYVTHVTKGRAVPAPEEAERWGAALNMSEEETELLGHLFRRQRVIRSQDNGAAGLYLKAESELDRLTALAEQAIANGQIAANSIASLLTCAQEQGMAINSELIQQAKRLPQVFKQLAKRL